MRAMARNERTPLVGNNNTSAASSLGNLGNLHGQHGLVNNNGKPLYEDDRAWVRMPTQFLHLTWLTLKSNYVNLLLVFVPVGIVLGALDMKPHGCVSW